MKSSFLNKTVIWNIIGITINSIYSIFLTMFVSWYGNVNILGQFSYAFYIASVLSMIGNYGGRIYQVSDVSNKYDDSNYISLKYFSDFAMLLFTLVFCFSNSYSFSKILLIFQFVLYRAFESISDAYYGVMQKNNNLETVGKSTSFKAIISTVLFIIIFLCTHNILLSTFSFTFVFLIFTFFYDKVKCKQYNIKKIKINNKTFELLKKCFPIFIFAFLTLLISNITRYFVDLRLDDAAQGYFSVVILPASLLTLFAQFLIQPLLTSLVNKFHNKNNKSFFVSVRNMLFIFFGFGIALSIIMYFIGAPILGLVYNIDLSSLNLQISLLIFAGICSGGVTIIYYVLTIMRKINIQIVLFVLSTVLSIVLSIIMITDLNTAIYSYVLTMVIEFVLFFIYYIFERGKMVNINETK